MKEEEIIRIGLEVSSDCKKTFAPTKDNHNVFISFTVFIIVLFIIGFIEVIV